LLRVRNHFLHRTDVLFESSDHLVERHCGKSTMKFVR
jgi:hypothetical protein